MSTTLTNGLKLPDKGSVDWYADMQSNYTILDGAVGTIAEHTSALSGKAPLVHTHTKSDITDFPVYGTTAGTICEGNDSRLSDARTPVAHTHGKADITDLFNSANTWSGNQTYTGMMILNSSSDVVEQFRQKLSKDVSVSSDPLVRFNTLTDSAGHNVAVNAEGHWDTYVAKNITLKYKNDSTKQGTIEFRLTSDGTGLLYPSSPFACDLGNSYNKWKTLNGINPGALSLPRSASVNIDTTNWNLRGGTICTITAPVDTYICVQIRRNVKFDLWVIGTGRQTTTAVITSNDGYYRAMIMIPCAAGNVMSFYTQPLVDTPEEDRDPDLAIDYAKYFYCLGNV